MYINYYNNFAIFRYLLQYLIYFEIINNTSDIHTIQNLYLLRVIYFTVILSHCFFAYITTHNRFVNDLIIDIGFLCCFEGSLTMLHPVLKHPI